MTSLKKLVLCDLDWELGDQMYGLRFTDDGLKELGKLENLEMLSIRSCRFITDDGVKYIGAMSRLKKLDISCTCITDDAIAYLRSLTSLKELSIDSCESLTD